MFLLTRVGALTSDVPVADVVVDQLWRADTATGDLRVTPCVARESAACDDTGWEEVERYLAAPSLGHPRILLPDSPRRALATALLTHRRLRPARARVQRTVLAAAVAGHVPLPRFSVQRRVGAVRPELPLDRIREAMGDPDLRALIGVRRGANRKATLQLVDAAGTPRGFAKLAWDAASAAGLRREVAALERVPNDGAAKAPRVLASGCVVDRPFLVTAPLPLGARALRGSAPPPSAAELGTLCPVVRRAPLGDTGQLGALRERLRSLPVTPETADVVASARVVVAALASCSTVVPVTAHWHGDLTPWNCARGPEGDLWVWDWEYSEEDAVAGLDAYHWWWSTGSERGERLGRGVLPRLAESADPLLVAFGVPRRSRAQVGALWAATIAERACSLAAARGEWDPGWVLPGELRRLLQDAVELSAARPVEAGR